MAKLFLGYKCNGYEFALHRTEHPSDILDAVSHPTGGLPVKRLYLCLPKRAKEMIGKKIPVVFRIMFVIWVILQVCLVIKYWDMPNHDDAQAYVKLASECIARGTWYPDVHNQYEDFIFGPGYVNLLIGIYHLCGSFSFVRLLNLLMNIAMVFEIRKLAGRMFSNKTG